MNKAAKLTASSSDDHYDGLRPPRQLVPRWKQGTENATRSADDGNKAPENEAKIEDQPSPEPRQTESKTFLFRGVEHLPLIRSIYIRYTRGLFRLCNNLHRHNHTTVYLEHRHKLRRPFSCHTHSLKRF